MAWRTPETQGAGTHAVWKVVLLFHLGPEAKMKVSGGERSLLEINNSVGWRENAPESEINPQMLSSYERFVDYFKNACSPSRKVLYSLI